MPSGTSFHPSQPFYPKLLPRQQLTVDIRLPDENRTKRIKDLLRPLLLSPSTIERVKNVFESELNLGLEDLPDNPSSLQMGNTYLPELPNGTEQGEYLALDLGGTNFRVTWLYLENGHIVRTLCKHFQIPVVVRQQTNGTELFDYLADCTYLTMDEYDLHDRHLLLGFSFSFPIMLTGLDAGSLVKWRKSFKCDGVVGQDAVELLREALRRRGAFNIEAVALLNDITGVLVEGAYLDPRTAIGVGIGTGTNACYLEKMERIKKFKDKPFETKETAIITEWGLLGANGILEFLRTEYDSGIDLAIPSSATHNYPLEHYTSGNYLGEVVRSVLKKLVSENLLFPNTNLKLFDEPDSFPTKYISKVEEEDVSHTEEVLKEMNLLEISTAEDIATMRYVCSVVSIRTAQLLSICLASLLERVDRDDTTVAVDGSVYKCHPKFHSLITYFVSDLVPHRKFQLMLTEDGSGKGAGLVAAIAKRLKSSLQSG